MRTPRVAALLGAMIATLGLGAARAEPPAPAVDAPPSAASQFTPIDAPAQAARMGRGINVLGYDAYWKDGPARFQAKHFAKIRQAGFSTLRVNLAAFSHMDSQGRLDPVWIKKLDWVVKSALANDLNVILDEHDFGICAKDAKACRGSLLAFWLQVGTRYRNASNRVIFELLNEPNGALTPEVWNAMLADALKVVRYTNPTRTVIIGPASWNSLSELKDLKLPDDDRNIIVTVHYYTPMEFTHQGAPWVESTKGLRDVSWGTAADRARVSADFDTVAEWAKDHRRPIFLGEFGAYDKGEMRYRAAYTAAVARGAEAHGWPWAYWQFDSDFIAWDMAKDDWVHPILDALVPPASAK